MRGTQLGRKLGYPTANIRLGRRVAPVAGIFAVRVHGDRTNAMPGVASLGVRPMVNGTEPLLEAHLFDFDGDLYGRRIEVEFVAKLRDEEKFADLDAMVRRSTATRPRRGRFLDDRDSGVVARMHDPDRLPIRDGTDASP